MPAYAYVSLAGPTGVSYALGIGRGVNATRQVAAPLRLLVAVVVVTGLLAAAPVACWCPVGDHVGQLLHLRFSHEHASDHATEAYGETDAEAASAVSAPAWSSAAGLGLSHWQAGVQVLPPLPTALHVHLGGTRLALDASRPTEHLPAPTFPPPR